MLGTVSLFAQTPVIDNLILQIEQGKEILIALIYWITVDVLGATILENKKKIISVSVSIVLGVFICTVKGINPFESASIFAITSMIIKIIKGLTDVSVTPTEILKKISKFQ
jgi:hypothetical protein